MTYASENKGTVPAFRTRAMTRAVNLLLLGLLLGATAWADRASSPLSAADRLQSYSANGPSIDDIRAAFDTEHEDEADWDRWVNWERCVHWERSVNWKRRVNLGGGSNGRGRSNRRGESTGRG